MGSGAVWFTLATTPNLPQGSSGLESVILWRCILAIGCTFLRAACLTRESGRQGRAHVKYHAGEEPWESRPSK